MKGNDDKLVFRKSSYSNGSGECVEVAVKTDGGRAVRDSKDKPGPTLHFTPAEWATFIQGAKAGEFDN
jgi:hypothetical protein